VGSSAPTNQSVPAISGVPTVGQTLTASTGSWTNSPTSYTYQWQLCSGSCSPISGATQSTYIVTSSDVGDKIAVSVIATNRSGSNTATSATTTAVSNAPLALNIGWLGDSIMAGGNACNEHTVNDAVSDLQSDGYAVTSDNRGVAGYGTDDWAAGTSALENAESSFSAAGVNLVVIMLGTNDARTPAEYNNNVAALTPSQHYGNMEGTVKSLTGDGFSVVLNEPIYTVPGTTSNGVSWPENVNTVYGEYWSVDSGLANGSNVFIGDTSGVTVMGQSGNLCSDGIHPSIAGAAVLGRLWANGIENRVSNTQATLK
jgi:lysophospholipase L1-like esterase